MYLTANEMLCHLLLECSHVKPSWLKVKNHLQEVMNNDFDLNCINIIFGIKNLDKENIVNNHIIYNFVIYITKWCIWNHRNNVIFGNNTIKDSESLFSQIIKLL